MSRAFIAPVWLLLSAGCLAADAAVVNDIGQLRLVGESLPRASHSISLTGNVWWANTAQGRLVLQDESGAELLEMEIAGDRVSAGDRVHVEGHGTITRRGGAFRLGVKGPVVDNNGIHGMTEKSGTAYLPAGRHAIRVEWFNGVDKQGLEVDYEGPGLPRQKLPVSGVEYRCYEGTWQVLPDFNQLVVVKRGTTTNFDLSARTRDEQVALQFAGDFDVPRASVYTFYLKSDDGSRLLISAPPLRARVIGRTDLPAARRIMIGQPLDETQSQWVEMEGKVTLAREQPDGLELELSAGAGRMRAEIGDASGLSATQLLNQRIRAVGFCQSAWTEDAQQKIPGVLLVPSRKEIELVDAPLPRGVTVGTNTMLTTADEVHRLKREEAQRGYPVTIRGVVTGAQPEHQAFTIQDATRGLYIVDSSASFSNPPQIGEFLEVEGVTDPGLFAPMVNARHVKSLGLAHLPEAARPTWDQLMNGSMDAQYVEIQGIVTAVRADVVTLLMRQGRINVELRVIGSKTNAMQCYENALVRIRGCLFATWNYVTHQVKLGEVRIYDADIMVDQPAPTDLFAIPGKTAAELLLFDPHASLFQRVKVSGQIVHVRDGEHFLMADGNGLRFIANKPVEAAVGDRVDVVGFPELSGAASPVLREAVARKTGHTALPEPRILRPNDLIHPDYDATRVRVQGVLMSIRKTRTDRVLEMQNGVRTFVARLRAADEPAPSLPIGGRLELAGVYAALGVSRVADPHVASFELLLNTPAEIRVLARPPWWTLERLLIMVGVLAGVLAISLLWITQLRRQVEERTVQLEAQIQARQRVEHQQAMEQERTRIAQDLHDELGSGITEISMLAARASGSAGTPRLTDEKRSGYLEQVGEKAREMVTALDEIVWAMNPRHDSLASLISYFSLYADRFLGLANIAWRLDVPSEPPDHVVDSRHRHQLFLAFKEALTNVVRHAGATEVRLSIQVEDRRLRLVISDDGCGLPSGAPTEEMDGVSNMRVRLERLDGRFEMRSEPGGGTIVRFDVPLS